MMSTGATVAAGSGNAKSTSIKSPSCVSQRSRRYCTTGSLMNRAGTMVCKWPPGNQDGKPVIRAGLSYEFAGIFCAARYQETKVPQPALPNREGAKPVQPTRIEGLAF